MLNRNDKSNFFDTQGTRKSAFYVVVRLEGPFVRHIRAFVRKGLKDVIEKA